MVTKDNRNLKLIEIQIIIIRKPYGNVTLVLYKELGLKNRLERYFDVIVV